MVDNDLENMGLQAEMLLAERRIVRGNSNLKVRWKSGLTRGICEWLP